MALSMKKEFLGLNVSQVSREFVGALIVTPSNKKSQFLLLPV